MLKLLSRIFRRRRVVTGRELAALHRYNLLGDSTKADSPYSRLIGYIPSDAIAIYLMGVGVFGGTIANVPGRVNPQSGQVVNLDLLWWLFGIVCALAPFLTFVGTFRPEVQSWWSRVQWFQVVSSPFAFTAWAFAIGGPFASLKMWNGQLGSLILLAASVLITAIDSLVDRISKSLQASSKPTLPVGRKPIVADEQSKPDVGH